MPNASERNSKVAKSHGGGAVTSNETPVSSAENPDPAADGTGNTASTRPHPSGAHALAGRDPPMSTDKDPERT